MMGVIYLQEEETMLNIYVFRELITSRLALIGGVNFLFISVTWFFLKSFVRNQLNSSIRFEIDPHTVK